MRRGEIWWASLPPPTGSGPGHRRPVLIIQTNEFIESRIGTVVVLTFTSNLNLAAASGNVLCRKKETRLLRDSVANVSQIATVDKSSLTDRVSALPPQLFRQVEAGLRLALGL